MAQRQFAIRKSDLSKARDANNRDILESAFKEAKKIIKVGGNVNVQESFSDGSIEVVDVIDNLEQLDHFKNIYLR
jgi:hypothetical protein